MKSLTAKEKKKTNAASTFSAKRPNLKASLADSSRNSALSKEVDGGSSKIKERSRTNMENRSVIHLNNTPRVNEDLKATTLMSVDETEENTLLSHESNKKIRHRHSLTFQTDQLKGVEDSEIEDSLVGPVKTKEKLSMTSIIRKPANTSTIAMPDVAGTSQIKVVARFRPLNQVELEMYNRNSASVCSKVISKDTVILTNNLNSSHTFTLDRIFDINTSQQDMFEIVAMPTINDVLNGYNGTIFAYGQSGSGKTHSMYGGDLYDDEIKGIIPRAIQQIFDFINHENNRDIKFELKFSMLEIYKENLNDLLNPATKSSELKIKEHPKRGIYVMNLTEEYISSEEEFLIMIESAEEYRVVSETGLNKTSSRSHLVFQLEIIQKLPDDTERRGMLNLVDLAGSEKVAKTHAVGDTLEEAKKINLSLSTLGNVISALTSSKSEYVPYRDSKLTRILQDSLGGNYKTTLITTCSPHIYNCEETISTLNFAARAKKIKNKVKMNIKRPVEQLEAMIESLSKQLNLANEEILRLKSFFNNSDGMILQKCDSNTNFNFSNINNSNINVTTLGPDNFFVTHDHMMKTRGESKKMLTPDFVLLNTIKQKDEEIQSLNDKMDILQEENKALQDKLTRISRETGYIYFYQILENLDNFTKKNIDEVKSLVFTTEDLRTEQLKHENEQLKESYKQLEAKYFSAVKEIEARFQVSDDLENELNNCNNRITTTYNSNSEDALSFSFDDNLTKYQMNFNTFFDKNNHNLSESYKNIYNNSKMYVNSLLKEFLKKKDSFGSRYGIDNLILPEEIGYRNQEENQIKVQYKEMKSSFMKMNFLIVYYEKIIFDLMNRVLVDIKKLEIESNFRIDIENKCANFNKSLTMYLEILDDLKEMKMMNDKENQKEDKNEKKLKRNSHVEEIKEHENDESICDLSKNPLTLILKSFANENFATAKKEATLNDEKRESKTNEMLTKKIETGEIIPTFPVIPAKESKIEQIQNNHERENQEIQELEEKKLNRFENNLKFLKMNNFIDQDNLNHKLSNDDPITPINKYNATVVGNELMSAGLFHRTSSKMPHNNMNIIKPVSKQLPSRLMSNIILVNKLLQHEGSTEDFEEEDSSLNNDKSVSNNNVAGFFKSFARERSIKRKPNKGFNWLKESLAANPNLLGLNRKELHSWEIQRELNLSRKEINLYKTTMESLSGELDFLKTHNINTERIILEYQENQKKIIDVEIENFAHTLQIYKSLYEEELKSNRSVIDELAKIIDDICINSPSNSITKLDIPLVTTNNCSNLFTNYINSSRQLGTKRTIINDFLEYEKEKLLTDYKNKTYETSSNGNSVMKIAEAIVKDGGTATKKLDYIFFQIEDNFNELKVQYGSGLNGIFPSKSPLNRNFKMTLVGDTHSDVESPQATD